MDDHELVVFGHVERFAHRPVKAVADRLPVGFRLISLEKPGFTIANQRVLIP
jgi:hypothetical protein